MTCRTCVSYLTDVDSEGNLADFHHDRKSGEGFCALRDLFYIVESCRKACKDYHRDEPAKKKKKE